MPESKIEQEMEAVKAITRALEPLDAEARQRVLDYVRAHLGLRASQQQDETKSHGLHVGDARVQQDGAGGENRIVDIRGLRDEKRPSTDMQMAALVAYYLLEVAPENLRKDTIDRQDVVHYFKQAGHPLPAKPHLTLNNAKAAGYLDSPERGKYKLNPVGHNLVVHNLPKAEDDRSSEPRRRRARAKAKPGKKKLGRAKTARKRTTRTGR